MRRGIWNDLWGKLSLERRSIECKSGSLSSNLSLVGWLMISHLCSLRLIFLKGKIQLNSESSKSPSNCRILQLMIRRVPQNSDILFEADHYRFALSKWVPKKCTHQLVWSSCRKCLWIFGKFKKTFLQLFFEWAWQSFTNSIHLDQCYIDHRWAGKVVQKMQRITVEDWLTCTGIMSQFCKAYNLQFLHHLTYIGAVVLTIISLFASEEKCSDLWSMLPKLI